MKSFHIQILLLLILGLILSDMVYYRFNSFHLYQTALYMNKNPYFIHVDLDDYKMYVLKDGKVIKTYPVSGGKASTPSPLGTWTIISKADWGKASVAVGWALTYLGANSEFMEQTNLGPLEGLFPMVVSECIIKMPTNCKK